MSSHTAPQPPPEGRSLPGDSAEQTFCLINGFLLTTFGLALLWGTPDTLLNASILAIGAAIFSLGLLIREDPWGMRLWKRITGFGRWLSVSPLQVLLLVDALLFVLGAWSTAGDGELARSSLHGWLWLGGILLIVAGLWEPHDQPRLGRKTLLPLLLGVGLALLALGLRLHRLDSLPYAVNGDEGSGGIMGLEFVRGSRSNLFGTAWHSFPSFYFWLVSLSQRVLGATLLAARLPSAIAGALAVLATYWAASRMFDRSHGVLAALILSASHVHLMFSRIAISNVWDGVFLALVLGAVWVAWTTNARWAFLVVGAGMGLGQLFYPTGRLLLVAVPLWLLFLVVLRPAPRRAPGVLAMALTAAVTWLPFGFHYASHPGELLNPLSGVAIGDLGQLLSGKGGTGGIPAATLATQFLTSVLGFTTVHLQGIYHPQAAMLLPLTAALFCFGALMLLGNLRDPRSLILLTALLGPLLVGTLSIEAPNSHRMQFILPVMAIVAAGAPVWAIRQIDRWRSPASRQAMVAGAYIGVVLVAAVEAHYFFVKAIPGGAYGDSATYASRVVSEFAADLPEGATVILFGKPRLAFSSFPSLNYLIQDHPTCNGTWPLGEDCPVDTGVRAFVVLAEQQDLLPHIRSAYPTGTLLALPEMPGNPPILVWIASG